MDVSQRNKVAVERYVELVWNRGELQSVGELIADDYVGHSPSSPGPVLGPVGVQARVARCRLQVPGLYVKIDALIAEADRVAISWRAAGVAQTEGRVYLGISVIRLLAGKQVEARTMWQLETGDPAAGRLTTVR